MTFTVHMCESKMENSDDDSIFFQASQQHEESLTNDTTPAAFELMLQEPYEHLVKEDFYLDKLMADATHKENLLKDSATERFTKPVTESDILEKIDKHIPRSTKNSTAWAVRLWDSWKGNRVERGYEIPPDLDEIYNKDLNFWLARFIVEVRTKKGEKYHGSTLYALCAGIQRHVREQRSKSADKKEPLDIYQDNNFVYFRNVLDSELKQLHQQGIGLTKKHADVISTDVENSLWREGY